MVPHAVVASVNECFSGTARRQGTLWKSSPRNFVLPREQGAPSLSAQVNGPSYSRRARTALVISSDPLGAALLGAATELAGCRVAYVLEGESVPDAIRRVKPVAVLLDATHPIVSEPASLGPALMTGASVILFGAAARLRDLAALIATSRASTIVLPDGIGELPALLTSAAAPHPRRTRSE